MVKNGPEDCRMQGFGGMGERWGGEGWLMGG